MKSTILLCLTACVLSTSFAAEKPDAIGKFRETTASDLFICRSKARVASMTGAPADEEAAFKCLDDGRAQAKESFAAALAAVRKKPTAGQLLKDYYAAWLTALGRVGSGQDNQIDLRLDEAWNKFEIEASL